jgi:predicted permease
LNVAQLMLARAKARQKELSIRQAIGGSPTAAALSVFTENVLVFLVGGGAALGVAPLVLRILERMDFGQSPFGVPVALDLWLLAYVLGLSGSGGLIFGCLPAFAAMRLDLRRMMADAGGGVSSSRWGFGGSAMVGAEFALAFVLVASTILMLVSLDELAVQRTGFEPKGVVTARVTLPDPPYGDWPSRRDFVQRTLAELRALPEVTEAAAVSTLPFADRRHSVIHSIDGIDRYPGGKNPNSRAYIVSPGYFEVMKIPLLRGRFLSETDRPDTQRVVVVDQRFVERELGGGDAIGRRLIPGFSRSWPSHMRERIPWYEIVGVVGDVMHGNASNTETSDVISRGIPAPVDAGSMYFTIEQTGSFEDPVSATYVLKGRGPENDLTRAMWKVLGKVDPRVSLRNVATLEEHVRRSWRTQETQLFLLRLFAGLAVILASVGVFGVMTSRTLERKKEFALRIALGETREQVAARVLSGSLRLIGAGLLLGTVILFPWIRFVQSVHPEISPGRLHHYLWVAAILTAIGAVSCLLPALRSAGVEPVRVLRE